MLPGLTRRVTGNPFLFLDDMLEAKSTKIRDLGLQVL
jgi:hypothetical protein